MFFKDIGDLFRQAKEIGENLRNKQEELAKRRIEVSVGGGMVKMTFTGKGEALSIEIDPELIKHEERAALQDLVLSAVNQGVRESQEAMKAELGRLAGGLNIPGITS